MKNVEEYDYFMCMGMEQEIEELKRDINILIGILEKHDIAIPKHIQDKMKKDDTLPFD